MTQKLRSITSRLAPAVLIGALLLIWQLCSDLRVVPKFMLPSPTDVLSAFVSDFPALLLHARVSLSEAFLGLSTAMILSFAVAYLMDRFRFVRDSVYPLLILTQTIPTVAIAPLLVLWLGYGILPKVVLIVITCFFPMTIGLLSGFASGGRGSYQPDAGHGRHQGADLPVCQAPLLRRTVLFGAAYLRLLFGGGRSHCRVARRL